MRLIDRGVPIKQQYFMSFPRGEPTFKMGFVNQSNILKKFNNAGAQLARAEPTFRVHFLGSTN